MGKKQREKKEARVEQLMQEKQEIEERRQERVAPAYATARRLTVAILVTLFILYIGVWVNGHLPNILGRLAENS